MSLEIGGCKYDITCFSMLLSNMLLCLWTRDLTANLNKESNQLSFKECDMCIILLGGPLKEKHWFSTCFILMSYQCLQAINIIESLVVEEQNYQIKPVILCQL